jgi:hypothetical protein
MNGANALTSRQVEASIRAIPDPVLTISEVATELRCSKAQVYRLVNGTVKGVPPLPALCLGRRKVVRRLSLEAWKLANENNRAIVPTNQNQSP